MSRASKITIITIFAVLGVILIIGLVVTQIASDFITPAKAEEILLNRHPSAYITDIELEAEGSKTFYELEFTMNNIRYTATVDGKTGTVISDTAEGAPEAGSPASEIRQVTDVQSATEKALTDAGFSKTEVNITKAELENENGKAVYDIEFIHKDTEYEYKIDKETGVIESISSEKTH